jgi:putative peptidoglycan lipid II flippase
MVVLSLPINCLLFQYGKFAVADAQATAQTAVLFSLGLFAFSGVKITVPVFYALNDSKTPVRIGIFTVASNILLGLLLMTKMSYFGLALSTSISATLNFLLLTWFLRKKLGSLKGKEILNSIARIALSAAVMAVVCWFVYSFVHARLSSISHFSTKITQLLEVSSAIILSISAYLASCWLLKARELQLLFQMITARRTKSSEEAEAWKE